jgi:hypothetical protein
MLFTGDIGVALLLRSCLAADATFPFIGNPTRHAAAAAE